jgi:hypothetical protein
MSVLFEEPTMKKIAIAVSVLLLVLALAQAAPPASQPAYASYYTGQITAVGAKTLELHVLRGHNGIIHPVNVDEKTEVVLLNGQPGKLGDLKVGQWVRACWNPDSRDPKQQRIAKIEPSMPSWAAQRLADLEKSVGSLEVAVRVFINGKGDEEELHLLGPDNEGGCKEPFFARLTNDDMTKLLRYLAVEGFLADAADSMMADGKLPLPAPPYVRLAVGKFYQAVSWTPDTAKRLEGIQAVLPDKAAAKMSGLLAKVREKLGVPATQPSAKTAPVDANRLAKAPVVLRVKWKSISPPGGNPSDTVEVLAVLKNQPGTEWGQEARIDHEPGKDGVPHDQECTVYLEVNEKLKGRPWTLLGGGADMGVSHVGPQAPAPATGSSASADTFEIKCRKPEDRINVAFADGNAVFTVTSPSGIGGAMIERKGEKWPKAVILRLLLHGLESLAISCGDLTLSGSGPSSRRGGESLRLSRNGKGGAQLTTDSPFWTPVRAFDASGRPVTDLPDKGGYLEVAVPKAVLEEAKAMRIEWIDFYRG